jgi:hypothetical protein
VPLVPSELAHPFRSPADRVEARRRLVERDSTLRSIESLTSKPDHAWTTAERAAFPSVTNGITDPPSQRVSRWASLFAEELAEIHRLVASRRPLSDIELQEAVYLAGRLLATVTGRVIDSVDDFRIGHST